MFRNIGFGAATLLAVGALAIGCSDDGDTIVGGSALRTGNFPGSQVDESNTATDGRAFTPPGDYFDDGMHVFWNRSNGHAIVAFTTEDDNTGQINLHLAHFDGSRLNTPVIVRGDGNGAVEDETSDVDGIKVLWLNTAGSTDADVAAKNGDAIILYTRNDLDLTQSVAASEEDSNRRLWLTVFDVSDANAAASGTVIRGFETAAVALDTDIQATAAQADTDVGTFGFVSDGLAWTHEFTSGTDITDSGQPTTYVNVFYGKDVRTSNTNPTARFLSVALNLAATSLPAAGGTTLTLGASSFATNEGVDTTSSVLVHNNMMLWQAIDTTAATEADDVVTVTVFNETTVGGVATQFNLGETLTSTNEDDTQMPAAGNFYGPDHGVDGFYAFFTADGFSDSTTTGDRNADTDLLVAFWPDVASPTREVAEIDNFTGTLDLAAGTGTDVDGIAPRNGALGNVTLGSVQTRIDRSANYITALWLQDQSDLTDTDNATPAGTFNGSTANDLLFARVVQTRKTDVTGQTASTRTLANSISATVHQAPGVFASGRFTTVAGVTQDSATDVEFQDALAQGQTSAQADEIADRGCSFQGNNLRMNFIYQAGNDNTNATTSDEDRLMVNGVVVTLDSTGTAVPTTALVASSEVVVETLDESTLSIADTFAIDAGDASVTTANPPVATATAGRVIVIYSSNDNSKLDNPVTGSFSERRLYAWESGTTVTLSTNPATATSDLFRLEDALDAVTVPVNENTEQTPSHVGNTVHLWWTEDAAQNGDRLNLATRSYALADTTATTAVPLAERFTPPTTDDPNFIDNPGASLLLYGENYINGGPDEGEPLDGSSDYEDFYVVRQGSTVGVFFDQSNRIFYQQTSTDADGYYTANGLPAPELVDNESDRSVIDYQIESPNTCDNARNTMVFFMKSFDDVFDVERVQVRIAR